MTLPYVDGLRLRLKLRDRRCIHEFKEAALLENRIVGCTFRDISNNVQVTL